MQQVQLNTHISGKFNQELENLRNSVLTMGGEVEEQMSSTLTAIRNNSGRLAEQVVLNDLKVNSLEVQIDEECMRIIAKRHPTASDLRLVMIVSKATTDIERIGDEIERIAKMVATEKLPDSMSIKSSMLSIGEHVLDMMRGTFNAFARQDEQAAMQVYDLDKDIDKKYKHLLSQTTIEMQQNPDDLSDWLEVLWALRAFERIGDRCKNICEYIIYLIRGKDIRHLPMETLKDKLDDITD